MQFAGADSSSPPVIDIPRRCMELLDLEKPALDTCAEPRLGQVAEQEFGLEDAAQVAVGAVEVILGGARDEALQGYRRSRVFTGDSIIDGIKKYLKAGAVLSPESPGTPISFRASYLRDNTLADVQMLSIDREVRPATADRFFLRWYNHFEPDVIY